MTFLSLCPRCLASDPLAAVDPACYLCRGSGMVRAEPGPQRAYWATVSRELAGLRPAEKSAILAIDPHRPKTGN